MDKTNKLSVFSLERRDKGYSTMQLMCVIAVTAVISAIAVPSYSRVVVEQYKISALNNFHHSVLLAKTEAIKSLKHIVLCPSSDGKYCKTNSFDYSMGWILFINEDKDYPSVRDEDEQLLQSVQLKESDFDLISNRKAYTFRAVNKRNTNGTLMFCPRNELVKGYEYQAVIVSYTGRPRVNKNPIKSHINICD